MKYIVAIGTIIAGVILMVYPLFGGILGFTVGLFTYTGGSFLTYRALKSDTSKFKLFGQKILSNKIVIAIFAVVGIVSLVLILTHTQIIPILVAVGIVCLMPKK